jgi:hypothetical protein
MARRHARLAGIEAALAREDRALDLGQRAPQRGVLAPKRRNLAVERPLAPGLSLRRRSTRPEITRMVLTQPALRVGAHPAQAQALREGGVQFGHVGSILKLVVQ